MIQSIWADTVRLPSFPPLEGGAQTDVLIIGGGITGLLCAHMLKRVGIESLVLEADTVCSGVTRNTTAKITSQHGLIYDKLIREFGKDTARLYWQANQAAIAQFRQMAQTIPCDFEEKDAFVYALNQKDKIETEMKALQSIGAQADYTESLPLPFSVAGAVRFPRQAQFHPLKFAAGLLPGLHIREHTAVKAFDGVSAVTDTGRIRAKHIIVATHFPIFNKHGGYFMKMYQDRSYVLALKNAPQLDGMFIDESGTGLSFRNDGDYLLLGGGAHRTGKPGGGWTELEAAAGRYYPECRVQYRWAAQDCMTLDKIPYIGRYGKNTPGLYAATGYNKWGMTTSMTAAMILCDLIQGKSNPYAGVFSPSRSILRPQLFVNLWETAVNLLTVSRRRCPHMGCALKWNGPEHSWDCPCHGSRFTEQGKLMDNPATGDLPNP